MGFMNVYEPMYIYIIQYYTYCTLIIIYIYFYKWGKRKSGTTLLCHTALNRSLISIMPGIATSAQKTCRGNTAKAKEMEPQCESLSYFVISCIVIQHYTTLYNITTCHNAFCDFKHQRDVGTMRDYLGPEKRVTGVTKTKTRKNQSSSPIKRYKTWHPLTMSWTVAGEIEVFWPGVRRLRFGEHPSRLYCTRMAREWTTAWCLLYRILV